MLFDNLLGEIECNRPRRVSRKQQAWQEPLHKIRIGVSVSATVSRPLSRPRGSVSVDLKNPALRARAPAPPCAARHRGGKSEK